jgi:hypothetical protein
MGKKRLFFAIAASAAMRRDATLWRGRMTKVEDMMTKEGDTCRSQRALLASSSCSCSRRSTTTTTSTIERLSFSLSLVSFPSFLFTICLVVLSLELRPGLPSLPREGAFVSFFRCIDSLHVFFSSYRFAFPSRRTGVLSFSFYRSVFVFVVSVWVRLVVARDRQSYREKLSLVS